MLTLIEDVNYEKIRDYTKKDIEEFSKIFDGLSFKKKQTSLDQFSLQSYKKEEIIRDIIIKKIIDNTKFSLFGELLIFNNKSESKFLKWYEYLIIAARSYQKLVDLLGKFMPTHLKFEVTFLAMAEYHNSMNHSPSFHLSKKCKGLIAQIKKEGMEIDDSLTKLYDIVIDYYGCEYPSTLESALKFSKDIKIRLQDEKINDSTKLSLISYLYIAEALSDHIKFLISGNNQNVYEDYLEKAKNISLINGQMDILYLCDKLSSSIKILNQFSFWNLNKFFKLEEKTQLNKYVEIKVKGEPPKYFLFPSQYDALESGVLEFNKKNLLVSMPTGAGKTLIGELRALNDILKINNELIVYISPSRALAREKYEIFKKIFPNLNSKNVCLLTGDVALDSETAIRENDIIIMTPEKFDIILRNGFFGRNISTIVFDEFHNMRTGFRGIRLQFNVIRARNFFPNCKMLFISAILSRKNMKEIALWIGADFVFENNWKPTFLKIGVYDIKSDRELIKYNDGSWKSKTILTNIRPSAFKKQSIQLAFNLITEGPCLIFSTSKDDRVIFPYVNDIIDFMEENNIDPPNYFKKNLNEKYAKKLSRIITSQEEIYTAFIRGIGVHKGDLPHKIRKIIEDALNDYAIFLIVSTSTLAEGVNLPIRSIIIPKLELGGYKMEKSHFFNLIGRAGRPFKEIEGQVVLVASKNYPEFVLKEYSESTRDNIESIRTPIERILFYEDRLKENKKDHYAEREVINSYAVLNSVLLATVVEERINKISNNDKFIDELIIGSENKTPEILKLKEEIKVILKKVEDQLIEHKALTKDNDKLIVTGFGQAIYRTGFCSTSCYNLYQEIDEIINLLKEKYVPTSLLLSKSWRSMQKILSLISIPIETDMFFPNKLHPHHKEIMYDWISGMFIADISKKYFRNSRSQAMINVESGLSIYTTWYLYSLFELIKFKCSEEKISKINYNLIKNLATFSYYGTSDDMALYILQRDISRDIIRDDLFQLLELIKDTEIIKPKDLIRIKELPTKLKSLLVQEDLMEEKEEFIRLIEGILKKKI